MRKLLLTIFLIFIIILIVIPALIVHGLRWDPKKDIEIKSSDKIKVFFTDEKIVREIPIDEYLIGVVAAEMPAKFELEALKAQAVAARTYAIRRIQEKKGDHPGKADLCTDFKHCQAWESFETLKKKWGIIGYYTNLKKIKKAVLETRDIVIVYDNKLIDPLYHSSCGGAKTENSEEVWGSYQPYLRSVSCEWDENKKEETKAFTIKDFGLKVFGAGGLQIFSINANRTSTGRIKELIINNKKVNAPELRKRLALKSTIFSWQIENGYIKFHTIGNGHGVGLCQYGANGLAKKGDDFQRILKHYYTGIKLVKIKKYIS